MEKELRVRFTGDAQDLRRAAGDAERAMRQAERAHRDGSISAAELGRQLGMLAATYLSLSAAANVAQRGLQGLASMEQSTLTFKVLFQDAERAQAKMQELAQFAAKTPFELPGIVDAAKALETFGLNSSKYLKDAGDLAAAFGVEISEVARAFGRINSGDFGEAFERLRDFGIARKDLEGEGLVFDKSGSYQGSVDQALTAVQAIIRRKFGGMMEEQSNTFTGQMSNLADNVQSMLNKAFAQPFDAIKSKVTELNGSIDGELGNRLDNLATLFGDNMYNSLLGILPVAEGFGNILLTSAEKANEVLGGVAAISAKAGADSARKDMLKQGIGGIQGLNTVQRVALQATSHHSLDDMLLTSRALGVSEQAKGQLVQLYQRTQQMAEKAADDQFIESYQSRVGAIKDALVTKKSTLKPVGGTVGGNGGSSAGGPAPRVADGIGGLYGPAFDYGDKFFGPADGRDYLKFQEVQGKQTEDLGARIERETMAYVKQQEQARKDAERLAADIQKKADDALRSGLEAGVSAFLDGGLQGFGSSIYSLSKQSFSKALVDSVMSNADLKNALGGLGHSVGGAGGVGAALAIGSVIWDTGSKVKGIWDESQAFNDAKGTRNSLGNLKSVSTVFGNTAKVGASHLASFSDAIKGSERQVEVDLALGKITETQAQAARGQIDAAKQLYEASKSQFDAAEEMKKSIEEDRREYKQKVALDYKEAVAKAQGRDLEAEDIGSWISRQQEWLATNTKGNSRLEDVAEGGFTTDEIIGLIGDGKNNKGSLGKQDEWLRQELRDLLIAQVNLGDRGGAAQSVGSLSNPDNALAFDAPVSRTVNNAFNIGIQTYAITGDKASIKDLARIMAAEIANIQGQAV